MVEIIAQGNYSAVRKLLLGNVVRNVLGNGIGKIRIGKNIVERIGTYFVDISFRKFNVAHIFAALGIIKHCVEKLFVGTDGVGADGQQHYCHQPRQYICAYGQKRGQKATVYAMQHEQHQHRQHRNIQ